MAPAKSKTDLGIFLFDFDYYDNAENSNFKHLVWGGASGSPPPLRMIILHIQAASKKPKPFWRTRRIAFGVHLWRQNHYGERAESILSMKIALGSLQNPPSACKITFGASSTTPWSALPSAKPFWGSFEMHFFCFQRFRLAGAKSGFAC